MAMFGGLFGRNGFGMDFGGGSGATGAGAPATPGFNDPGGLGEKLDMAGSAILGAYNGGAGALSLDALRKLHQRPAGDIQPGPPVGSTALPGGQPLHEYLRFDPLTGHYRPL